MTTAEASPVAIACNTPLEEPIATSSVVMSDEELAASLTLADQQREAAGLNPFKRLRAAHMAKRAMNEYMRSIGFYTFASESV